MKEITLGQFFTVWGVRFDERCLGAACGRLEVAADAVPVADAAGLRLWEARDVQIRVTTGG